MPSKVDIVVVTYNSAGVLGPTLDQLCRLPGTDVIVVDNKSCDNSAEIAERAGAKVIRNSKNLGFGVGCNIGAAAGEAEFILFVNPDAIVKPKALRAMLEDAERHPEAGAFNPQLINGDGTPYQRGPSILDRRREGPVCFGHGEVDVLSGAVLLCRRAAFEQIGGFDEEIFLFFEDDDLSIRLTTAGWKLRQVGDAVVTHVLGTGSKRSLRICLIKERAFAEAQRYVAAKHGKPLCEVDECSRALRRLLQACVLLDRPRVVRNLGRLQGFLTRT
ncbi:glycosyltransferase family 2 protein [Rhodobacteraceae bacterium NNCM2]|nr:glycosyltransferase family 2 protein [Coraliihabitans acroporae]